MKFLKKSRSFICGVLVGALTMAAVPVLANNELVSVMIDNTITLIIANESKPLPADYAILNYNGYTYLPSRYVAERLGATVSWDAGSRTINITEPPPKEVEVEKVVEVPVEKLVYVDRDESYQRLPATQSKDGTIMRLNSMSRRGSVGGSARDNTMSIAIEIDNRDGASEVVVDYGAITIETDGKAYKTSEVPGSTWDSQLVNGSVAAGTFYSGFYIFPAADAGTKNYILTVPVSMGNSRTSFMIKFTATTYSD